MVKLYVYFYHNEKFFKNQEKIILRKLTQIWKSTQKLHFKTVPFV